MWCGGLDQPRVFMRTSTFLRRLNVFLGVYISTIRASEIKWRSFSFFLMNKLNALIGKINFRGTLLGTIWIQRLGLFLVCSYISRILSMLMFIKVLSHFQFRGASTIYSLVIMSSFNYQKTFKKFSSLICYTSHVKQTSWYLSAARFTF